MSRAVPGIRLIAGVNLDSDILRVPRDRLARQLRHARYIFKVCADSSNAYEVGNPV